MDQSLLDRLQLLPHQLPNLTESEQENIENILANPDIRKYLRVIYGKSVEAFLLENEVKSEADEKALVSYFNKLKGIEYLCTFLLNNFSPEKLAQKAKKKDTESKGA